MFAAVLYAALAISLGPIQRHQTSDTILSTFVSVIRYEPYYWGENRFGMLVPLITSVFRQPYVNLLAQTLIYVLSWFGAAWFLHRLCSTPESGIRTPLLLQTTLALTLLSFQYTHETIGPLFLGHPHILALAICLAAAYLVRVDTKVQSTFLHLSVLFTLLLLAFWVHLGSVIVAALLLIWRAFDLRGWVRRGLLLIPLVAAFLTVDAVRRRYPGPDFTAQVPLVQWPESIWGFLNSTVHRLINPYVALALVVAVLLIASGAWVRGSRLNPEQVRALTLMVIAFSWFAAFARAEWVRGSGFQPRYGLGPVALFLMAASYLVATAVWPRPQPQSSEAKRFTTASVALSFLIVVGSTIWCGFPSYTRATEHINHVSAEFGTEMKQLRCTHLVGDYWWVWRSMLYMREYVTEYPVWAVTYRDSATRPLWQAPESRRYCTLTRDPEGVIQLHSLGIDHSAPLVRMQKLSAYPAK